MGHRVTRARPDIHHEQRASWWSDGDRYRLTIPHDASMEGSRDLTVPWTVRLTEEETEPALVPRGQRCPVNATFGNWPPYTHSKSKVGRVRSQLMAELGPMCAGCGGALGVEVDHQHFDGLVRGLLCRLCNGGIENCPHLQGCPWADYLNNPPAARLHIPYPNRTQDCRRDQRKIDHIGLNPHSLT